MATNTSTTNHTGESHASISIWEGDTEGALGGDIEELEIYGDDDNGVITVGSTITMSGATGVSASAYRRIFAKSGDGWEGDLNATDSVTINITTDWAFVLEEDYFQLDGLRFVGDGNYYTIDVEADNLLIARCFFDGRDQIIRGIVADTSPATSDGVFTRCVALDVEYGFLFYNGDWELTNCTALNCDYGIASYNAATCKAINNISLDSDTTDYYSDGPSYWASGSGYNIGGTNNGTLPPDHLTGRSSTESTSPGTGDWVMFVDITADSEDLSLQDHAENDAVGYGDTLTGEAVTDAYGNSANDDWDCGAFNLPSEAEGEIYDITISSSVDLNHTAEPQRWRDRVTGDNFSLNDNFILEIVTSYVINSILISSDLTLNDGTGVQRWRDRVPATELDLESSGLIQRWRDRIPSSTFDLGSTTWVQRERNQLLNDAMALGSAIGQQLHRFRQLETPFDVYDVMDGVYRQRNQLLESYVSLESRILVARALDRSIFSTLNLYDLLSTEGADGVFDFAVGRVAVPTDTTTITLTSSNYGGGTPKAAIIILCEATANDTPVDHAQISVGFTDGTRQYYLRVNAEDGVTPSDTTRRMFSDGVMSRGTPGDAAEGVSAEFSTFVQNGIELTATSNFGAGYLVHYILLGGTGLTAYTNYLPHTTGTASLSNTDPGFEPDILLGMHQYANLTVGNNIQFGLGVAVNDGNETQRNTYLRSMNNVDPVSIAEHLSTDYFIKMFTSVTMDVTAFTENGWDYDATGGNQYETPYLALKIDNGHVDLRTLSTPTATGEIITSDLNFKPQVMLMGLTPLTSTDVDVTNSTVGFVGVYLTDGVEEYTAYFTDRDGVSTSNTTTCAVDELRVATSLGATTHKASTTFRPDGYSQNYTVAAVTAYRQWALAFAGPETARTRARELLSTLIIFDALSYTTLQFLLHAITLHSQLELEDTLNVEREVMRLCESFVAFYDDIKGEHQRNRRVTDTLDVYDDILQDAIKVLSDILLHDNLELTHKTIVSIQRLFKPIGVIIYGLDKARIEYAVHHGPGKIEYTLGPRGGIVYRLLNIKGETQYHD